MLAGAFPTQTYETLCEPKSKRLRRELDDGRQRLRKHGFDRDELPEFSCHGQVALGYRVKVPYTIYSEKEFRKCHGIDMQKVGLVCNTTITNEHGDDENVLAVRKNEPRTLEVVGFKRDLLQMSRMSHYIRSGQAEDTFSIAAQSAIEERGFDKPKARIIDEETVQAKVSAYIADAEKSEEERDEQDDDEADTDNSEVGQLGGRFFGPRRGATVAQKGGKLQKSKGVAVPGLGRARRPGGGSMKQSFLPSASISGKLSFAGSVCGERPSCASASGAFQSKAPSERTPNKDFRTQVSFDWQDWGAVLRGEVDRAALAGVTGYPCASRGVLETRPRPSQS